MHVLCVSNPALAAKSNKPLLLSLCITTSRTFFSLTTQVMRLLTWKKNNVGLNAICTKCTIEYLHSNKCIGGKLMLRATIALRAIVARPERLDL